MVCPGFVSGGRYTARENRANFVIWVFFAELLFLALVSTGAVLERRHMIAIAVLIPFYLLGTYFGIAFHRRVSDRTVRRAVLALVAIASMAD